MPLLGSSVGYLQGPGALVNGNGSPLDVQGAASVLVEVVETAGGTCTLALQGSFDGTNWYAVGYQRVDNTATPARAVANISVTANLKQVYQLLDFYPQMRAVISSIAGSAAVSVRAYGVAT